MPDLTQFMGPQGAFILILVLFFSLLPLAGLGLKIIYDSLKGQIVELKLQNIACETRLTLLETELKTVRSKADDQAGQLKALDIYNSELMNRIIEMIHGFKKDR